jgi:hypothetical protein
LVLTARALHGNAFTALGVFAPLAASQINSCVAARNAARNAARSATPQAAAKSGCLRRHFA